MCERIFSWIFRKSCEKHEPGNYFLNNVCFCITEVQSDKYARETRTAMLWSVISAIYLWRGDLEAESFDVPTLSGVFFGKITPEEFLVFLLAATAYYSIRLFFSLAKIWSVINPLFLFWLIHLYHKRNKPGYQPDMAHEDSVSGFFGWLHRFNFSEGEDRWRTFFVTPENAQGVNEAMHFMVRRPVFGLLQNIVFPVIVFPGLCLLALGALVLALWF